MNDQLLETWQINARINLYLISNIQHEWLSDLPASKGRNIAEQFAHIHNVRLMWLKEANTALLKGISKIEKKEPITKKNLEENLIQSANAISIMLEEAFVYGKIKGFKPHPVAFLGYILAHEAHHRGQIMITLKENNHLKDKSLGFALWQWGTR